ncbi:hypothetical protein, partial [Nocardia cyriacigeorgica]|uniref:hypothetical protein n=1 Tax=Nocardia cyriacigeorgica TaxID=135487 RepID=UPI00189515FE
MRVDLASFGQSQCESLIQATAAELGYDLLGTLTLTATPLNQLRALVTELSIDAVLCPSYDHFDGRVPIELLSIAEVIV